MSLNENMYGSQYVVLKIKDAYNSYMQLPKNLANNQRSVSILTFREIDHNLCLHSYWMILTGDKINN